MSKKFKILCLLLLIAIFAAAVVNANTGFLYLSPEDFFGDSPRSQIAEIRVNRILVMLLAGISIPTSGFLMQEYFRNPLAGPDILGITSVASLSVAFYIFFSHDLLIPDFLQNSFLSLSSIAGGLLLMLVLLSVSGKFQDKSYLVIFGFLVSAFAGAIVSLLQFYAENQSLKNYVLWSFGANNMVTRNQIYVLAALVVAGMAVCFHTIKPLIGNALGTAYAQSFGVDLNRLKIGIIAASSLLSASVTAFMGPVLFIGIIVPHFCRLIYNPSRLWQQWMLNMGLGMLVMLIFSIVAEKTQIPLNVISSVFGIPVILIMLLKQNKA